MYLCETKNVCERERELIDVFHFSDGHKPGVGPG